MYAAHRPADTGQVYWRFAQFLFPFYVMIPSGVLGLQIWSRAWLPMDDEHMLLRRLDRHPGHSSGARGSRRETTRS
jgi:hypothetical protein